MPSTAFIKACARLKANRLVLHLVGKSQFTQEGHPTNYYGVLFKASDLHVPRHAMAAEHLTLNSSMKVPWSVNEHLPYTNLSIYDCAYQLGVRRSSKRLSTGT
jgi:hypothetical protein